MDLKKNRRTNQMFKLVGLNSVIDKTYTHHQQQQKKHHQQHQQQQEKSKTKFFFVWSFITLVTNFNLLFFNLDENFLSKKKKLIIKF